MLVSLSPRATQQILLRSCSAVGPVSAAARAGLLQAVWKTASNSSSNRAAAATGARLLYSTCTRARPASVLPSVRQRRPVVRGEAVAFHVKDLDHSRASRPLGHHAPAAAYDDDEEEDLLYDSSNSKPKTAREYESDMIVVVDLDECLIHSQFLTNNPGAKFYAHQVARNAKDETGTATSGRVDTFRFHLPDGDLVQVNKRPFLEDFLKAVTDKYETHIYTAAMKIYAEPILDMLDPEGDRFAQRWYRESCDLDKNMGAYVTNLGNLSLQPKNDASTSKNGMTYDEYLSSTNNRANGTAATSTQQHHQDHLRRVVLVDNNPLSFLANPTNGILVSSFYNDPADKTLPAVLDLLEELEPLDDVRPTLDSRFGLKAALSEIQGNRRQQQTKRWTSSATASAQ